jgi:hypothetical protein
MASTRDRVRSIANDCGNKACARFRSGSPMLNAPEFVREAHRQSALVAASDQDRDDQAFVDAVSPDWDDDT